MKQPEGFSSREGEHLVCKLKKSIYDLKQASHQWYYKFHGVITSFGFVENPMDQCIYLIRGTVGMRNQQNLYPKAPTAVAKLLQYSGLGSNSWMGFLRTID